MRQSLVLRDGATRGIWRTLFTATRFPTLSVRRRRERLQPYTPEPGWYAISDTSRRLGTVRESNPELYASFRTREPIDRAGYSIGLYKSTYPPEMPVTRAVIVGTPAFTYRLQPGTRSDTRVNVKWVDNLDSIVLVNGPARYITDNLSPFDG